MEVSKFLAGLAGQNYDASFVKDANGALVFTARPPVPPTEGCVGTAINPDSVLAKALLQGVFAKFQGALVPSVNNPGKFQASIEGTPIGEFDTENDAMNFLCGFTFGLSVGGGIKNMADGFPSRLE